MPDDPNTFLILGEIRGQLRELVHTSVNNSGKIDGVGNRINALEVTVSKFGDVMAGIEKLTTRVDLLETEKDRRQGAIGIIEWFLKNWPAIIGFVTLIVGIVLIMRGVGR